MSNTMRLDKFLANMGMGSRKEVKQLIKDKQVKKGEQIITNPDFVIDLDWTDITVKGYPVHYQEYVYIILHKPAGYISATEDPKDQTVIDLIDHPRKKQLFPVGRLDKDTEGLLLLTDDGELTHQLLSPKYHVKKIYYAEIDSRVTKDDINRFKQGITIDGGYTCMPAELVILEAHEDHSKIELTIMEGKFHQVKRMFEAVHKSVTYLKRIKFAELTLPDSLEKGDYMEIEKESILNGKSI